MEKHLKPFLHYSDLYDKYTVEHCRRIEKSLNEKDIDLYKDKKISKKQVAHIKKYINEMYLHYQSGERYLNKESTIREWMSNDQRKDELYESTQAPEDIRCLTCRNRMKPTFKQLWSTQDKGDRILFMYDCPNNCVPRRAFFSDGEEWRIKPDLCPQCDTPLKHEADSNEEKIITTYTCSKCSYTKTDEFVLTKKEEDIDENFAKDRDCFCMTEEDGKKFQEEKWQLAQLGKFAEDWTKEQKARDEKLKANPNGFHLDGQGYGCFICGAGTHEGDNWYDKYGIKCLICQKAIDNGEIPASLAENKDSWYSKYEIERNFGVKSPTLRKWVRKGIIKERTVSCYGKGVHYELFLIKDNKDFLPPKKIVESKSVTEIKDGKKWYTSRPWYQFGDPREKLKGYKILDYIEFTVKKD
jgi:hypothetical protein